MTNTTTSEHSVLEEAALQQLSRTAGIGTIVRIVGPVVDVQFGHRMPSIYTALTVEADTPVGHVSNNFGS
jgi:F-type H+-transporting ATPase subunit beta